MNSSVRHPKCVAVGICLYLYKGSIINSDENDFFGGSCQILIFFAHNAEVVNRYVMASGVMMIMDR